MIFFISLNQTRISEKNLSQENASNPLYFIVCLPRINFKLFSAISTIEKKFFSRGFLPINLAIISVGSNNSDL